MKYRESGPRTRNDLATLWLDATNRDDVSRLANRIDELLREDAHLLGESREEFARILFALPFVIEFVAVESAGDVFVVGIWKTRNR